MTGAVGATTGAIFGTGGATVTASFLIAFGTTTGLIAGLEKGLAFTTGATIGLIGFLTGA